MKHILFLFVLFFSSHLLAQNESDKTDKMIDEMCIDFKNSEKLSDSLRVKSLNEKFIFNYLDQFQNSERNDKIENLYFRFQKRCQYFREYLQRVDPITGGNWVRLNKKPDILISNKELEQFKKYSNFYYFEYGGDKTLVHVSKKYWIETFSDGTNSKLFFKWIDKSRFEIEFIESNNNTRKNFSNKGDKYNYQIMSKENNFFWVIVETLGQDDIYKFKLFPEN